MYVRSFANAAPVVVRHTAVSAAAVTSSTASTAVGYGTAGEVMYALNHLSLGRDDLRLRRVKTCIDQAVYDTFNGHATVQHQGSTRKGTGIAGSDWDFYVHLNSNMPPVTHKQRIVVVEQLQSQLLPAAGIDYSIRCGANRVKLWWNGSDGWGMLPDVDMVFARFKHDAKKPPRSKAFAHSQEAQQVVKYIKRLPVRFTQLPKPNSSLVEALVLQLQQQEFENTRLKGKDGFEALLTVVLEAVAGVGGVAAPPQALEVARVDSREWQAAAGFVLEKQQIGPGWLTL